MKLPLAYYGHPILRKKAAAVKEINDEIRQFIQDMTETMQAENGWGLAAPQVHRSLAIFLTHVSYETPQKTWVPGKLRVFINPKILDISKEECDFSEGCLSIPGLYGKVNRPIRLTFEALDIEGKVFSEELLGLEARAFLHENDHINGVLWIDRVKGKARQELEPKLREIKKKYNSKK
jgi:peptide deformylase